MNKNSFLKHILFALMVVLFASCDNGFNEIGANIVGGDNFGTTSGLPFGVIAYNQPTGPVQTNNLPVNPLGIYDNPVFGKTTYNFVTQVQLATVNPVIGNNPVIESAVLSIPYFSVKTGVDTDGVTGLYTLDSIYGPAASKLKLSVYETDYFIRGQDITKYYSDQSADFTTIGSPLNNDTDTSQNNQFAFSAAETQVSVTTDLVTTVTRSVPAMRLNLKTDIFTNKILLAPAGQLATNDLFTQSLRGLYFKVEATSSSAATNMAMMNFKGGTVTIKYLEDVSLTDNTPASRVEKTIILNLTGNSVSLPTYEYSPAFNTVLNATPNITGGDDKLYLRGGQGSMSVIKLFAPGELEEFRANRKLINDASLTFTIDQSLMTGATDEPKRIYLYDLDNKHPLLDYYTDATTSGSPKYNKFIHGGIIVKQSDGRGLKYKIKITNYIRNLVKNDTLAPYSITNFRLGLVVTENINDVSNVKLKNSFSLPGLNTTFPKIISDLPTSSVTNPLGTILYGNNILPSDANYDKRLQFNISFTKPN